MRASKRKEDTDANESECVHLHVDTMLEHGTRLLYGTAARARVAMRLGPTVGKSFLDR